MQSPKNFDKPRKPAANASIKFFDFIRQAQQTANLIPEEAEQVVAEALDGLARLKNQGPVTREANRNQL